VSRIWAPLTVSAKEPSLGLKVAINLLFL
jgi:hypothetical protein